jgi:hypothetical protein
MSDTRCTHLFRAKVLHDAKTRALVPTGVAHSLWLSCHTCCSSNHATQPINEEGCNGHSHAAYDWFGPTLPHNITILHPRAG